MADIGHEQTDEMLEKLEKRIKSEYEQALKEMQAKLDDYMKQFAAQDKLQRELLEAGAISKQEYKDWRFRHIMMGKRWEDMRDVLAEDMHNANLIANSIVKGYMPDVYALNCNFATYAIEHDAHIDTGFSLYNHDTAELLLKEQQQLLPPPSARKLKELKQNPDIIWNEQKIQSAVFQGVVQGESVDKIAARLRSVADMNYHAFVRNARTMTTNAQNLGRERAYTRAEDKGVKLTVQWYATLDGRTRHSHRLMHGKVRDKKEGAKFSNGCRYPGDPTGPAWEVYNCRCTTLSWVKGFEGELVTTSPKMGDMTFEEWQQAKPRRESSDREQYERYKEVLGKSAPKSFSMFEDIKYEHADKWEELKTEYRQLQYHKSNNETVFKPISDRRFNELTLSAKKQGADIHRNDELARMLLGPGKRAVTINDIIVFGEEVSLTDVHEELRHFWQNMTGLFDGIDNEKEREYRAEIEAKKYLITNAKKFRIPRVETEETKKELAHYEQLLEDLLGE